MFKREYIYIIYRNWENYNWENFGRIFREKNEFKEDVYNIKEEKNSFIKLIIDDIKGNDKDDINYEIKLTKENSNVDFTFGNYM